jgi:UDP-glucose 4-epimerase
VKKNILITGGLGYIGSRLSKFLSENDYNVFITTRKKKEIPFILNKCNVIILDSNDSAEELQEKLNGIEIVIHLAALNENQCINDPEYAIHVNVTGTLKILNAAIFSGVSKFVYFSTAHVYSSPLESHLNEEKCTFPIHPYAITHRAAEDFILAAHQQNKIECTIIRLSNAFGAPIHKSVDRWTLLVNDLCKQIVETKKILLKSSGVQVRNFITLSDVCRGVLHLIQLNSTNITSPIYNLGGPSTLSVNQITDIIITICQKKFQFSPEIIRPNISEKVSELFYDSSKIKSTGFSWENKIELEIEETLEAAYQYFSKR